MKKIKKYILFLIALCCINYTVNAKSNPYPKYEESVFGGKIINCTWYAWEQAKNNMGVELPFWTYVQTWYNKAKKAGYSVGKEPKPNSLMIWNYGEGFGGHVAYVTSVEGTTVNYKEGGSLMTESGINTDSMTLDMMSSFLVGFIYLDEVPKQQTPEQPTKPSKEEAKPKAEQLVKSSNNYLSNFTISGINFSFTKDIFDYAFTVFNEIENVTIEASPEDTKSSIAGTGTFPLTLGENNFNIIVTAEDKTTKEYHILITRKEVEKQIEAQEKKEKQLENQTEEKPKDRKKILLKMTAFSFLIVSLIVSFLHIIIHKTNKKVNQKKQEKE